MAAELNLFDYYRRAEPFIAFKGATPVIGFDYYRRGEPDPVVVILAAYFVAWGGYWG